MKFSLRWILIFIACTLRLVGLRISPPAFYIDEAMGAAHSLCYQQTGHDLFGHIGLFSKIDFGGFQSAPFILSGALWTAIFGPSPVSFRSWTAFVGILTVIAVYRLVINAIGDRDKAIWATLFAACLPWAFQFSRISWDAPLATCFLIWGVATIYKKPRAGAFNWSLPLAGILFAFASYTYAPMRLNAGLLLLLLPGVKSRDKATALAIFVVLNIPVLPYYADAEFIARSKLLALTSNYSGNPYRGLGVGGLLLAFITQAFRHFSFNFLLAHGDKNVRHSIQTFGMLDAVTYSGCLVALIGWAYLLRPRKISGATSWLRSTRALYQSQSSLLMRLSIVGLFAGVAPAALTWEGIPHAIRSLGAMPFFTLLAAEGWMFVTGHWPRLRFAVVGASAMCFVLYLHSYFTFYPRIAAVWFDESIYQRIMKTHDVPAHYGAVGRAYYRMAVQGERCDVIQKEFRR